ncbi:MAG TPA: ABC transporter permease [Gemmatimonadales bacterium]|nr:ABC transporter permease [Gemmatimonadales bacterium]
MIDAELLLAFGAATVRVATPLALAALGEMISERGGVLNLGIEGAMLGGAFGAAWGAASGGALTGVAVGALAGLVVGAVFGLVAVIGRADQIIAGTAVTMAAIGITGMLAVRTGVEGQVLAESLDQSRFTVLAAGLAIWAWWLLWRTRFGLELRAAGESAISASAAGVSVSRVQLIGTLIGGLLAGVAGASLVLAQVGSFAERMTAGRGFIAIAIVILGRGHPAGVLAAALLFGAATALQYLVQAAGVEVPYQLLLALPYLLALGVLAAARSS